MDSRFLTESSDNHLLKTYYYDYIINSTVALGANKDAAVNEMKHVIDFEVNLYKVSLAIYDRVMINQLYN